MSDQTLLLFGVGVTFIFVAGVYVFVGERYERLPQGVAEPQRADANGASRRQD